MKQITFARSAVLLGIALTVTLFGACSDQSPTSVTEEPRDVATAASNDTAISTASKLVNPSSAMPQRDSITGGPIDPEFSAYNFPQRLALTDAQKNSMRALRTAHTTAMGADSTAYLAILEEARAARAAGKPAAEVDAILASATLIAERLRAARVKFEADMQAVLTAEQRKWLIECRGPVVLTTAQQQQIAELEAAYKRENAADLAAVQAALTKINAIRADSASYSPAREEQVRQILDGVKPARERLTVAQRLLADKVKAVVGVTACSA